MPNKLVPLSSIISINLNDNTIVLDMVDSSSIYLFNKEFDIDKVWIALRSCINNNDHVCNLDSKFYLRNGNK